MALTNIFLARHGQTEYNRCNQIQGRGIDASLNKTGRKQAEAIAHYLSDTNLHRVISSSLKRSRETAELIAEVHGLEFDSYTDLDEMNFGVLEGRPISEIKTDIEKLKKNWQSGNVGYASEGGESPKTVLNRAASRIDSIINGYQDANILFVLHGRLIRILVSHWLEYGLSEMHRVPHTNGALYHIRWDGQIFEPIYLNHTKHLRNGR